MRTVSGYLITAIASTALLAGCGSSGSSSSSSGSASTAAGTTAGMSTTVSPSGTATVTDTTASTNAGQTLHVAAANGFRFSPSTLTAKPGKITIIMTNPTTNGPHNIALKGNGVDVAGQLVQQGGTSMITAVVKAGTYEFYCQPHESLGMKGTLTVS